ncbi:SQUAMOSA PROMOTER-BINDING-LIKE PROTEIN 4 [Salix purpurea]|uniref:SQUAMOSA PROMOTER-BINDING-LIKE PROTEIN 4 n=1 Tax=Salix purpurea TaxID=77065 RepID=A0A9Q0Z3A7_SALPP|nr:SQUAMOSA PROMOTER-BINDING-LIKE PROTEIN 4 [Salix purpurea]
METSSSSSPPQPQHDGNMEFHRPPVTNEWDWGDLLDFTVDEQFPLSFDTVVDVIQPIDNPTPEVESQQFEVPDSDRVRKRDPRLTCSNFLAGIIPCACPEMDELLLEEEAAQPEKKRARVARAGSIIARCQVPSCEADISELKGYHRRHRVCLGCANATAVVLDGETKRYCQQCGKFHVLSDFDEGKRSCRRKLERHNNRRRRKPADSSKGSAGDKEVQGGLLTEKIACDAEASKDGLCSSSQMVEKEGLVESEDGHISALNSDPLSQNVNSDSGVSFTASGDTRMDCGKDNPKLPFSPSNCENKSAYSSMCPTGRISFKLYDWNPAEFPRRLRHQIFQWLASMPVELEGYIRPGCTILTVFLAMPTFMWVKLLEDPESYLNDLLGSGMMLSKKGRMCVYLNNMIFNVTKDGNSVMKVNVKGRAPRLHYVHPTCFEAGKPIELVVCGSNLLQTKFRFLVSFAGKYLAHDSCVALPQVYTKGASGLHHQLYKILTHCIEPNLSGPLFIEVENESGLSNFIPVLIGDREVCSEMKIIQQRFDASRSLIIGSECEVSTMRQTAFSEFSMDIAWLLKEPSAENSQQTMTSFQIRRVNSLLNFLLHHESIIVLDKILKNLKIRTDKREVNGMVNTRLLQSYMDCASSILHKKLERSEVLKHHLECPGQENCDSGSCCVSNKPASAISSEDLEQRPNGGSGVTANTESIVRSGVVPLLNRDADTRPNPINETPKKSCGLVFSNRVLKNRPSVFVIAMIAVCFGACAILLHPQKVSKLAVSIRRCLTDRY